MINTSSGWCKRIKIFIRFFPNLKVCQAHKRIQNCPEKAKWFPPQWRVIVMEVTSQSFRDKVLEIFRSRKRALITPSIIWTGSKGSFLLSILKIDGWNQKKKMKKDLFNKANHQKEHQTLDLIKVTQIHVITNLQSFRSKGLYLDHNKENNNKKSRRIFKFSRTLFSIRNPRQNMI